MRFLSKIVLRCVIACIPLIGHVIATCQIMREKRLRLQMVLWIAVVWMVPFYGPLLYLLVGRLLCARWRRHRLGWLVPGLILALLCFALVCSALVFAH